MSLEVVQDKDVFRVGYINVGGQSFPSMGRLPKRGSLIGLSFNSKKHLDTAIAFLRKARRELYGK